MLTSHWLLILKKTKKKTPAWCTLRVRMVNLSRATTLSKFFSSISFMYISYSSWRWGGTRRLWSAKPSFTLTFHNHICITFYFIYYISTFFHIASFGKLYCNSLAWFISGWDFCAVSYSCEWLTIDKLPLLLDDLMAEVSVLFKTLHYHIFLSDHVVLEQRAGLHLCVLDLQLVDLAEEAKHFPLLLWAHTAGEKLFEMSSLLSQLCQALLQSGLKRTEGLWSITVMSGFINTASHVQFISAYEKSQSKR